MFIRSPSGSAEKKSMNKVNILKQRTHSNKLLTINWLLYVLLTNKFELLIIGKSNVICIHRIQPKKGSEKELLTIEYETDLLSKK